MAKPKVVIVDDALENIRVLNELLKNICDRQFATNGEAAIKIIKATPPDLILLDVVMPGIDGYEVCRRLKADAATRDIPVVFVTARSESQEETLGFSLGAVDYITKPFNALVVQARVRTHLELAHARRELMDRNKALRQERDLIENLVTRMRESSRFCRKGVRTLETAVEKTAGDFMLSAMHPSGIQHLLVGDFTGHGLPAAMGAPIVSYIFYRLTEQGERLADILQEINKELRRKLPMGIFMAACLVEVHWAAGQVRVWNHGLPAPLLFAHETLVHRFPSIGMPLGIREKLNMPVLAEITRPFGPTDRLFVYSDGVTEAKNPRQEMYGEERLASQLQTLLAMSAPLDALLTPLRAFQGHHDFADDVTVMAVMGDGTESP